MKRRAIDKQKNYMVIINTCLFAVGAVLVFYNWYVGFAQRKDDALSAISQLTLNDTLLLSTAAILIGGLFYSIVILRPDFAKRQREKELLELTIEATHHDDYTDKITGRYNSLFFQKTLSSYLTEFNLANQSLGLLFIEAIHQEDVSYDVLREIGDTLVNTARDYDIVARIDIKRFAVITPYIQPEDLRSIASRFRSKLAESKNIPEEYEFSIGTAFNDSNSRTVETMQDAASKNLSVSKRLVFDS
jgi:GGDEF domain-containing protein